VKCEVLGNESVNTQLVDVYFWYLSQCSLVNTWKITGFVGWL